MIFTIEEQEFLKKHEVGRLATVHNNIPHVKPVSYLFDSDFIWIATDYETRTFKNLKSNQKAAITIDIYKTGGHQAVCIQGNVEIISKGPEFQQIFQKFFEKFSWVRKEPWDENEAPFLKIIPKFKTSWGLT